MIIVFLKLFMLFILAYHYSALGIARSSTQPWQILYRHSAGNLYDVCFIDSLNGWIVGGSGTLLHTEDGGYTWQDYDIQTDEWLTSLFFSDSEHAWIVGNNGKIFHTSDSGTTWVSQDSPGSYELRDIFFLDDSLGWIVGGNYTQDGYILRTANGGKSWQRIGDSVSGELQGVHFINGSDGWVVGGESMFDNFEPEVIWHTDDGGETWERQYSPTSGPLLKVFFLDSEIGWAVGMNATVINTSDGGETWNPVEVEGGPPTTNHSITDVVMPDSNNLWVGSVLHIWHSSNGGAMWVDEWDWDWTGNIPSLPVRLSMYDSRYGWAVLDSFVLGYSSQNVSVDGGQKGALPLRPFLGQNYPNPFNSQTFINYSLPKKERISLQIHDLQGRKVSTIFQGTVESGEHTIVLNGSNLSSGIYILQLRTPDFAANRKILLLR